MIVELLHTGKENAILTNDLVAMLGLSSGRELQAIVARERNEGEIICSTTRGGYFKPKDTDELREFVRTLEKRANSTFLALQSARRELEKIEGQEEMKLQEGLTQPIKQ